MVTHYCCESFTTMEDCENKLLQCSKCKVNMYSSKEAQKRHWKYHKHTCSTPNPEVISGMRLEVCLTTLEYQFQNPMKINANTVLCMKRIRTLLESEETKSIDCERIQAIFGNSVPDDDSGLLYYNLIWSAPGMTDYLLNENLCSKSVAALREKYPLRDVSDFKIICKTEDLSAYNFCFLLFNLLLCTALSAKSVALALSRSHHGNGLLRHTPSMSPLSVVAGKRVLSLYFDRFCRYSCGEAISAGTSFCWSVLSAEASVMVPGHGIAKKIKMNRMDLVLTFLNEIKNNNQSIGGSSGIMFIGKVLKKVMPLLRRRRLLTPSDYPAYTNLMLQAIIFRDWAKNNKDNSNFAHEIISCLFMSPQNCLSLCTQCLQAPNNNLSGFHPKAQALSFLFFLVLNINHHALRNVRLSCKGGIVGFFGKRNIHDSHIIAKVASFASTPYECLFGSAKTLSEMAVSISRFFAIWDSIDILGDVTKVEGKRSWYNHKQPAQGWSVKLHCMLEVLAPDSFSYYLENMRLDSQCK